MFYFSEIYFLFFLDLISILSTSQKSRFIFKKHFTYHSYILEFCKYNISSVNPNKAFSLIFSRQTLNLFTTIKLFYHFCDIEMFKLNKIKFFIRIYKSLNIYSIYNSELRSRAINFKIDRNKLSCYNRLYFGCFVTYNIPAWYMHVYNFCRFVPRMHVLRMNVNFFSIRFFYRLSLAGIP